MIAKYQPQLIRETQIFKNTLVSWSKSIKSLLIPKRSKMEMEMKTEKTLILTKTKKKWTSSLSKSKVTSQNLRISKLSSSMIFPKSKNKIQLVMKMLRPLKKSEFWKNKLTFGTKSWCSKSWICRNLKKLSSNKKMIILL